MHRYKCPQCKQNERQFSLVYKMAQEITKDPDTGEVLYYSDELETMVQPNGQPDLDIRCGACGYVDKENAFFHQA